MTMLGPQPLETYERRSYGMWQKPRSAGLFGLRWGETVLGFGVVITALVTVLIAGVKAGAVVAIIGIGAGLTREGDTEHELAMRPGLAGVAHVHVLQLQIHGGRL